MNNNSTLGNRDWWQKVFEMKGVHDDAAAGEALIEYSKYSLVRLLTLLKIAGLKRKHITAGNLFSSQVKNLSKYVIRFSIVSLSVEYGILVPYNQRDVDI